MYEFNCVEIVRKLKAKAADSQNEANQYKVKAQRCENKIKQLREQAVKFPQQTNKISTYIYKYQKIASDYIGLARKSQEEANKLIVSAEKIQSNEREVIRDLNILHENMGKCKDPNEKLYACRVVMQLIQKHFLQEIKPYSDSWKNCGGK